MQLRHTRQHTTKQNKTAQRRQKKPLFVRCRQQQTEERSSCNRKQYVPAFVSQGAANPPGNKQKISVRTHEAPGLQVAAAAEGYADAEWRTCH